jgi:hypothetical protein
MSRSPDRAAVLFAKFNAINQALVTKLREMPAAAAEHVPGDDQWSAAQVGWHVALTNDWIAGVLLGSTPAVHPAPAGFKECFDAGALPATVNSLAAFEPPPAVSLDTALGRLRASGQRVSKAIAALTPERGANYCVTLGCGTLSLFEFAEFAASHLGRHVAQVDRALARA